MRHFLLHAIDTEVGNAAEKWGVAVQMDAEKKINAGAKSPALIWRQIGVKLAPGESKSGVMSC